ncbi:MAG: carboxypeptidase-like regulatory domain-containing protein, partial [Prevotellaceae bacterium]|nr:carboxypeptidase-like regulatory domain-containing protein [Prevotellaceae bacterium]
MQNKATRKSSLLLPGLFFCTVLCASPPDKGVQGFVRDAATSEPLIGATVMIKGSVVGAVTDVEGYYDIRGLAG